MADNSRAQRLAKRILQIVATAIEREIKDPRLEFVTITDARVTGDLHDATLYYTVRGASIDQPADHERAAEGLEKARGSLRKIVGEALSVRFTPTLKFELDTVPETSARMEDLLARARERDAELAELRKNARPAGDENPYKN
ncbi:30S ribosome-binding factor RbfA [Corynebacterium sp. ES2794-CONJ1]|uniref:30S ribosome-binding factor RbfA n=1 Tax=unclassified Corynebacterium TaxID=2624378 RepID=UPI002169303B|nr:MULTISPECIES: 30S ribosome-binding factor RbfA [unclassified Corynebacterium]MCS4489125.1 30S ribosome-binding factor RbfA [Corynebacterium sp. ES2775-CONJ]MCS4490938.1 30S ribosome-binding factor RbfA [Corynebacterium sp. ES2715-CONJ3]MCS4531180.1 30S ribosome-binding factor RbfA [Corynebacterium sp. ES2730-CONJ]MCU9518548.1 30S ribosome-binding factor RbfA [Corynebacterium sp. ES2794-CONJ1]